MKLIRTSIGSMIKFWGYRGFTNKNWSVQLSKIELSPAMNDTIMEIYWEKTTGKYVMGHNRTKGHSGTYSDMSDRANHCHVWSFALLESSLVYSTHVHQLVVISDILEHRNQGDHIELFDLHKKTSPWISIRTISGRRWAKWKVWHRPWNWFWTEAAEAAEATAATAAPRWCVRCVWWAPHGKRGGSGGTLENHGIPKGSSEDR